MERKIEEKIKAYEKLQTENSLIEPQKSKKSPSKVPDVNEKWLDNLIIKTMQHNSKIKELTKGKKSPNKCPSNTFPIIYNQSVKGRSVASYLTGFKIMQDEFSAIRTQMNSLIAEQQKQNHKELAEEVHKLSLSIDRIAADNESIKQDHAELFHALGVLGKRANFLEQESSQLKEIVSKAEAQSKERTLRQRTVSKAAHTVPASKQMHYPVGRVNTEGVSDWVLEYLKK
eukprot:TRINITY_DN10569_c0_g1_i5.p1 TRINITY_DN10569_c0_g1~~TRINITY_DN10569_c0_g1_i5.p1  ORF type:complete len:229 (-),score=47.76 TRINITY_DN10569_c0_g1_i5:118-804(-)